MGVLKRKEEPTESITLRVPASVKAEIDRLRERANQAGFDLNATMCETMVRLTRQMREEMDALSGQTGGQERSRKPARADGLLPSNPMIPTGRTNAHGQA
jgi:hypothetical protein